jgi:hypothetical protein|nr:MAG TPA: hypothetical protein [Caudoviricetes sp.]DAN29674.1 MAG TPA: hypothetical protein [Caudoviricetes sp.]DAN80969.1 MAG TPA: hypothetical protein [Caudoviricetes sp.]
MLVKDLINKLKQVNENNEVVIVDNYNNLFSKIEVLIAKNERDKTKELIVIDVDF